MVAGQSDGSRDRRLKMVSKCGRGTDKFVRPHAHSTGNRVKWIEPRPSLMFPLRDNPKSESNSKVRIECICLFSVAVGFCLECLRWKLLCSPKLMVVWRPEALPNPNVGNWARGLHPPNQRSGLACDPTSLHRSEIPTSEPSVCP